jgi:hypothetical protein
MTKKPHIFVLALTAAVLLAQGCSKQPVPESSAIPVLFSIPRVDEATKTVTNASMPSIYNIEETFKVFAAYSSSTFNPYAPESFINFWPAEGLTCSYNYTYKAWVPSAGYYWPLLGYLSFYAYSPAEGAAPDFSWTNGFTWNNFTVPAAGYQYDLLYTDLISNKQSSDYTVIDGNAHDDDPDDEYIYNGVNLKFKHALSLIQVQACSALGSYSSIKYYVQKVVLHNAYYKGSFTSNTQTWDVNEGYKIDYTLLDLSGESAPEDQWQMLPGSDEYPTSVHPNVTLLLLPQDLADDAELEIVYKCSTDNVTHTTNLPLSGRWERGKKHTYKLIFSADIEFQAHISAWDEEITHGSYLIVQ